MEENQDTTDSKWRTTTWQLIQNRGQPRDNWFKMEDNHVTTDSKWQTTTWQLIQNGGQPCDNWFLMESNMCIHMRRQSFHFQETQGGLNIKRVTVFFFPLDFFYIFLHAITILLWLLYVCAGWFFPVWGSNRGPLGRCMVFFISLAASRIRAVFCRVGHSILFRLVFYVLFRS